MKGAVQGLATTTASTPVKNEPARPCFCASEEPVFISPPPNSATPDIDSPSASMR